MLFKSAANRRFFQLLASIEDWLAILMFATLGSVVFLQFFTRYVLNDPLGWTEEIARYLLICTTYFGCVVGTRREAHISLEVTQKLFPKSWINFIAHRIVPFFSLILFCYLAWSLFSLTIRSSRTMTSIHTPLTVIYIPIIGCLLLMALHTFITLINPISKSK